LLVDLAVVFDPVQNDLLDLERPNNGRDEVPRIELGVCLGIGLLVAELRIGQYAAALGDLDIEGLGLDVDRLDLLPQDAVARLFAPLADALALALALLGALQRVLLAERRIVRAVDPGHLVQGLVDEALVLGLRLELLDDLLLELLGVSKRPSDG